MKLGAEPKKVGALAGLLGVAGIVFWINSGPSAPPASSARPTATSAAPSTIPVAVPVAADNGLTPAVRREASGKALVGESKFVQPPHVDPSKVDPTLKLDLLARVQAIGLEGGARNIFELSTAAVEQPKPIPNVGKLDPKHPPAGPKPGPPAQTAAAPSGPPPAAPAPPINLKYYGFSTKRVGGEKKAFFLDGDEILVAAEGQIMTGPSNKRKYRVVKIGDTSVQVEDVDAKSTQTLPIQQPEGAPA